MLTVEALHLLLTRPDGRARVWTQRGVAATGAVIADLVGADRFALTNDGTPRLQVRSTDPTGDAVLDAVLPQLTKHDGKRLDRVVTVRALDPRDAVLASLAAQGVLDADGAVLDPEPVRALRARLAAVLAGDAEPDAVDATLIAILRGLQVMGRVLRDERAGLPRAALRARLTRIAETSPTGQAVGRAVRQQVIIVG